MNTANTARLILTSENTCSVDDCRDPLSAKGMCGVHYHRAKRNGTTELTARPAICSVYGCDATSKAKGLCNKHYQRFTRTGEIDLHPDICSVVGCGRPYCARGLCRLHHERVINSGSAGPASLLIRPAGTGSITNGYLRLTMRDHPISSDAGLVLAHRLVLFEKIGPGEHPCNWCGTNVSWDKRHPLDADGLTADHLDFDRLNNDPSNLVPSCGSCNAGRRQA